MSFAAGLNEVLPKPKYTGEEEELRKQRGPRIVSARDLDESQQLVLKVGRDESATLCDTANRTLQRTGPPPYGQRVGWRPRAPEDWGDGGAFPEVLIAQYPGGLGKKTGTTSNALAIQVDGEGKVDYDVLARQGHAADRIIHTSFRDLIPLRQRADAGEINLERPSEEVVEETRQRTEQALARLISGAVAAQKPKNIQTQKREATFVRYTPNENQMGESSKKGERVLKIVERQRDPMSPPRFKHKRIPGRPPSPPPPQLHSPPRKLTAEDVENWRIPPVTSNWKNPKGFTIALDKRLAASGRGLQDVTINDKFVSISPFRIYEIVANDVQAQFSEALFMADRHAREEVAQRALMAKRLAEKEKEEKESHLRDLAQQARQERTMGGGRRRSRSRSASYSGSASGSGSDSERERRDARKERQREEEKKLRQSRMGAERRAQVMAREMDRDISEKVALGLAKPTASGESMYDSRLFNQSSGFASGINEDNFYDKPLFAAQDVHSTLYRPRAHGDDDDEEAGEREMDRIQKTSRFGEALGRGKFKGTEEAEAREGPVQFEKDVFDVDNFLSDVNQSISAKRGYGLQGEDDRGSKRARVGDEED
jgi:SNW domain-containing protein 1